MASTASQRRQAPDPKNPSAGYGPEARIPPACASRIAGLIARVSSCPSTPPSPACGLRPQYGDVRAGYAKISAQRGMDHLNGRPHGVLRNGRRHVPQRPVRRHKAHAQPVGHHCHGVPLAPRKAGNEFCMPRVRIAGPRNGLLVHRRGDHRIHIPGEAQCHGPLDGPHRQRARLRDHLAERRLERIVLRPMEHKPCSGGYPVRQGCRRTEVRRRAPHAFGMRPKRPRRPHKHRLRNPEAGQFPHAFERNFRANAVGIAQRNRYARRPRTTLRLRGSARNVRNAKRVRARLRPDGGDGYVMRKGRHAENRPASARRTRCPPWDARAAHVSERTARPDRYESRDSSRNAPGTWRR